MKINQRKKTKCAWLIHTIVILTALEIGNAWAHEDVVLDCDTQNVYESTSKGINDKGVLVENGGTLTAPAGVFTAGTYACESDGTFSHGYSLCGSGGVPQLFYGKGFPVGNQQPPFINNGFDKIKVF